MEVAKARAAADECAKAVTASKKTAAAQSAAEDLYRNAYNDYVMLTVRQTTTTKIDKPKKGRGEGGLDACLSAQAGKKETAENVEFVSHPLLSFGLFFFFFFFFFNPPPLSLSYFVILFFLKVAANAERRKIFDSDLPEVLDRVESLQCRAITEISHAFSAAATVTQTHLTAVIDEQVASTGLGKEGREDGKGEREGSR